MKKTPQLSESTQLQTAFSPNTFTAQYACIQSQKKPKIWNSVYSANHSDNTLPLLGIISFVFL